MTESRKIIVNALTRVEGEGALEVRLDGERIQDVKLSIYEPPRFFEALLRGRAIEEVPDITARICGICPVAYQMTSVHALEDALDIEISSNIRRLRRLLYCGEWIESHVLHILMLNAPDFFGCHSGIELAQQFPKEINCGLRIKKIGNQLLEVLGGRAIHPVNVRVGGFHRVPRRQALVPLLSELRWALQAAIDLARWVGTFDFPQFCEDCEFVALQHDSEYPMNHGRIASTKQAAIEVSDYDNFFVETHVAHSTALHSARRDSDAPYLLGPISRLNLNHQQLFPQAAKLVDELCPTLPLVNRFHAIIARCIEVVHACEEAITIIEQYQPPQAAYHEYESRAGYGVAATEAPRGLIYHSYEVTANGQVGRSNIVPPTSQNQRQIESDLRQYLPHLLQHQEATIAAECEKLIRSYDPCISCSTHFLRLTVWRE
jgi:coenzyme F420-reducing hydrogenase alpha subunit